MRAGGNPGFGADDTADDDEEEARSHAFMLERTRVEAAPGSATPLLFSWLAWVLIFCIFRVSLPQVCARCFPRQALQFSRDCALGASAKVNTCGVAALRALVFRDAPLAAADLSWLGCSDDGTRFSRAGPNSGCCDPTRSNKNECRGRKMKGIYSQVQLVSSHAMRICESQHAARANLTVRNKT